MRKSIHTAFSAVLAIFAVGWAVDRLLLFAGASRLASDPTSNAAKPITVLCVRDTASAVDCVK